MYASQYKTHWYALQTKQPIAGETTVFSESDLPDLPGLYLVMTIIPVDSGLDSTVSNLVVEVCVKPVGEHHLSAGH